MRNIFYILLISILSNSINGQGCSDAGGCSVGTFRLKSNDQQPEFFISYSQTLGLADKETIVSNSQISLMHHLGKNTMLEIKAPYILAFGNLGFNSGVGDIIASFTQRIYQQNKNSISTIVAGKLKSNHADASSNEGAFPMVYQSSLGTNDLIGGINVLYNKWGIGFFYQHPFGRNQNKYLTNDQGVTPDRKQYNESANLKRGDDLILRIQRTMNLNPGNSLVIGSIPMYRIQKSEIIKGDIPVLLEGSDGLTINIFLRWNKEIDESTTFSLTGGFPVIVRDHRSDGLTRTLTLSAQLTFGLSKYKKKEKSRKNLFDSIELK